MHSREFSIIELHHYWHTLRPRQEAGRDVNHRSALHPQISHETSKQWHIPLYIAFLDISNAYDKAWLDAIMYVLWHSGIRGKIWRMTRNLSKDTRAQIRTKYRLSRIIKMEDNIRQGRALSVTEYSKMVDTMCSVLLMDDITLLADSPT